MKIAEAVAIKGLMRQPLSVQKENGTKRKENICYGKKNSTGNFTSSYRGFFPVGSSRSSAGSDVSGKIWI